MRAHIGHKNGVTEIVRIDSSYSKAGIHHYKATKNKSKDSLIFEAGEQVEYTKNDIAKLTYLMS